MNDGFEDSLEDLVSTEQLNVFNIIEHYCNDCDRFTPHHIEENSQELTESISTQKVSVGPLSIRECVICRENEEESLDSIH